MAGCDSTRFSQEVTDDQLASVVQESKPQNTKRQEQWANNIWMQLASERKNCSNGQFTTPPKSLGGFSSEGEREYWICKFIMEVKNSDGEDYNPTTLKCLLAAIYIGCSSENGILL